MVIFLLLIVVNNLTTPKGKSPEIVPTPSVIKIIPSASVFPGQGEALPNSFPKSGALNYSQIPAIIGKLVEILPYQGKLFSLSYDYSKDSFTLYLNKNDQQGAEKEFEAFLKTNDMQGKNWLQNLNTVYQ